MSIKVKKESHFNNDGWLICTLVFPDSFYDDYCNKPMTRQALISACIRNVLQDMYKVKKVKILIDTNLSKDMINDISLLDMKDCFLSKARRSGMYVKIIMV